MNIEEKLNYICDMSSTQQVILVTVEELAELTQAISKLGRSLRGDITLRKEFIPITKGITEEIADVYITICQIRRKFMIDDDCICDIIDKKVERTYKKLTQNIQE